MWLGSCVLLGRGRTAGVQAICKRRVPPGLAPKRGRRPARRPGGLRVALQERAARTAPLRGPVPTAWPATSSWRRFWCGFTPTAGSLWRCDRCAPDSAGRFPRAGGRQNRASAAEPRDPVAAPWRQAVPRLLIGHLLRCTRSIAGRRRLQHQRGASGGQVGEGRDADVQHRALAERHGADGVVISI